MTVLAFFATGGELQKRMEGALESFSRDLGGLRTGRASASFLDPVMVSCYGAMMPLNQVATVSVGDARMLVVQVWDQSLAKSVDKAVREAGLGLNPVTEGAVLRIPLPDVTAERRQELVKVAGQYAEKARIAVRNIRRDVMDDLKKQEKNKEISEDDLHRFSEEVQTATDQFVRRIDELLERKQQDITRI
jgi:ribosome recycling factor